MSGIRTLACCITSALVCSLFVSPAMAMQAKIGADAFKRGDIEETTQITFDHGEGHGAMDSIDLVTNVLAEDGTQRDVPDTVLPESTMEKDGYEFAGWMTASGTLVPDKATLHGLEYNADTDGDGKQESFSLGGDVQDSFGGGCSNSRHSTPRYLTNQ